MGRNVEMRWIDLIQDATKYLANVCDGANSQDGCGFNKIDPDLEITLPAAIDAELLKARRRYRKYRGRLTGKWMNVECYSDPNRKRRVISRNQ